jgi:hydrogenase maturation protease
MIAIVFCGNLNRSDDGVGPAIFRLLRDRSALKHAPDVRMFDAGTDGMAVMFAARGCRTLMIVDACCSGSEPGTIFEVPGAELAARPMPALSTHDFHWEHALFAGRKIFRDEFPNDVTVILIEAKTLALGTELSSPVARAASKLADRIETMAWERNAALVS